MTVTGQVLLFFTCDVEAGPQSFSLFLSQMFNWDMNPIFLPKQNEMYKVVIWVTWFITVTRFLRGGISRRKDLGSFLEGMMLGMGLHVYPNWWLQSSVYELMLDVRVFSCRRVSPGQLSWPYFSEYRWKDLTLVSLQYTSRLSQHPLGCS